MEIVKLNFKNRKVIFLGRVRLNKKVFWRYIRKILIKKKKEEEVKVLCSYV